MHHSGTAVCFTLLMTWDYIIKVSLTHCVDFFFEKLDCYTYVLKDFKEKESKPRAISAQLREEQMHLRLSRYFVGPVTPCF